MALYYMQDAGGSYGPKVFSDKGFVPYGPFQTFQDVLNSEIGSKYIPFESLSPSMQDQITNADPNSPLGKSWKIALEQGEVLPSISQTPGGPTTRPVSNSSTSGQAVTPTTTPTAPTGADDRAAIEAEGVRQHEQTLKAIEDASGSQQDYAAQSLKRMLPSLMEDYNSRGLLNSSALSQELGVRASQSAEDLAANRSQQIVGALTGQQGFQTAGLNREFSVSDFARQAQLSKELGAMSVPQVGGGKSAVGSTLQGIGSLAPYAALATGNPGVAAAAAGANAAARSNSGGGGGGK